MVRGCACGVDTAYSAVPALRRIFIIEGILYDLWANIVYGQISATSEDVPPVVGFSEE